MSLFSLYLCEVVGCISWVWSVSGEASFLHCQGQFFFHLGPWAESAHCSHAKLLMLLQSAWFCPSWTIASLLVGQPQMQIKRLQAVQNAAARVVVRQRKHDHITTTLRELHWLPVHDCILPVVCIAFLGSNDVFFRFRFRSISFLSLIVLSMKTCHSISLNSIRHTLHLVSLISERVISWCSWAQGL